MFPHPSDKQFRTEYAQYLAQENPNWSSSTVDTHVSDSFYIYNNSIVKDFWSCLENEKSMQEVYYSLLAFIENKKNLTRPVSRADYYFKDLQRLKCFVDFKYNGIRRSNFLGETTNSNIADNIKKSNDEGVSKSKNEIVYTGNLWINNSHETWLYLEQHYWDLVKPQNMKLEQEMEHLDWHDIEKMETGAFYDFLYEKYFVWKFTAPNRLATTRMHLEKYLSDIHTLQRIHRDIFTFDRKNVEQGLAIVQEIHGLGYAGASGLLGILFPEYFGVVDQFVCANMVKFGVLEPQKNPESLAFNTAVKMIYLFREKADELNKANNTDYWTPRKIDKVLWAYGR